MPIVFLTFFRAHLFFVYIRTAFESRSIGHLLRILPLGRFGSPLLTVDCSFEKHSKASKASAQRENVRLHAKSLLKNDTQACGAAPTELRALSTFTLIHAPCTSSRFFHLYHLVAARHCRLPLIRSAILSLGWRTPPPPATYAPWLCVTAYPGHGLSPSTGEAGEQTLLGGFAGHRRRSDPLRFLGGDLRKVAGRLLRTWIF